MSCLALERAHKMPLICTNAHAQGSEAEQVVSLERQGKYLGILDRLQVRHVLRSEVEPLRMCGSAHALNKSPKLPCRWSASGNQVLNLH